MKLWIDDLRSPPDNGWFWTKNSSDALVVIRLAAHQGGVILNEISFDHDLGGEDIAVKVANEIERLVYLGHLKMPAWKIHSANPVGRANLERALRSAERFDEIWLASGTDARVDARVAETDDARDAPEDYHGETSKDGECHAVL